MAEDSLKRIFFSKRKENCTSSNYKTQNFTPLGFIDSGCRWWAHGHREPSYQLSQEPAQCQRSTLPCWKETTSTKPESTESSVHGSKNWDPAKNRFGCWLPHGARPRDRADCQCTMGGDGNGLYRPWGSSLLFCNLPLTLTGFTCISVRASEQIIWINTKQNLTRRRKKMKCRIVLWFLMFPSLPPDNLVEFLGVLLDPLF